MFCATQLTRVRSRSFNYDHQFMNPGPAPRPPVGMQRQPAPLSLYPPSNASQTSLNSPSLRSASTFSSGTTTPSLSRTTTFDAFTNSGAIKQGMVKYREGGITNLMWKTKYAVLRQNTLEFQKAEGSKISFTIILAHVTGLARFESIPNCFELIRAANPSQFPGTPLREQPQKALYMKFDRDDDLYEWQDNIYNRCPSISGVSAPTNFSHKVHVGFDAATGAFNGLPQEWEKLLNNSAITKDDYRKNPQAVIEVLEFYSDIQNRGANPDQFTSLTPTPPLQTQGDMRLGHNATGSGSGSANSIAPPRPPPPGSYPAGAPAYGMSQNRSQASTPSQSRNVSDGSYQSQMNGGGMNDKLSMGPEMRRIVEEEKRKVQEQQDRQRRDDAERERREFEEYNASLPKKATPMAQQEVGGFSSAQDPSRYTPGRAAPAAPSDRSRQQAPRPGQGPTPERPAPPRAPYSQSGASSRDQSPSAYGHTRADQQPRPPAPAVQQRTASPQPRAQNGANGAAAARVPAAAQPKPLNVNKAGNGVDAQRKEGAAQPENGAAKQGGEKKKEVRMSSMSESEVMAKLRKIVTRYDPNESYQKQKKIGQGASGSVYIAKVRSEANSPVGKSLYRREGSEARVAIKTMDLRHQQRKELIVNEIIVMKESVHPNIVNYLDSFLIEHDSELWVIMEYMNGGALTDVIENNPVISEDQISAICNEVRGMHALGLLPLTHAADLQGPGAPARPGHHPPRHQERQRVA